MCVNVYGNEVGRELLKETFSALSLNARKTFEVFQKMLNISKLVLKLILSIAPKI